MQQRHLRISLEDGDAVWVAAVVRSTAKFVETALTRRAWVDAQPLTCRLAQLVCRSGQRIDLDPQGALRWVWEEGRMRLVGALPDPAELRGARVEIWFG